MDSLSNKYLGTSGKSYGSYDKEKGCYTGGIFTDAKTSSNHEIWERIVRITDLYYKDNLGPSFKFFTWSWPGDPRSPFKYHYNDRYYFDKEHTKYNNYLAKFNSTITNANRSWTDVLRDNGYKVCHDTIFPSRFDGQPNVAMYNQLILNASYSRKDALVYRTNSGITWDSTLNCGKEASEYNDCENSAIEMYKRQGEYYKLIESLRHDTANGLVHGEIIDSYNSYSEKIFLQQVLEFCRKENIKVITKKEAYDVCFNNVINSGNLIYNVDFKNSAKDFLSQSGIVPNNPDGYRGDCHVKYGKENTLIIDGYTYYLHYGIPIGTIAYEADIQGTGNIKVYAIQNKSPADLGDSSLKLLYEMRIRSKKFKRNQFSFVINDYPEKAYDQLCEGLGDKIMGIKIVYEGDLSIKNINMQKVK
ncbi:MAG: hypothetical protein SPE59_00655 [Treponema sp.]|nr:hypothetical protein [Treponema sp.]